MKVNLYQAAETSLGVLSTGTVLERTDGDNCLVTLALFRPTTPRHLHGIYGIYGFARFLNEFGDEMAGSPILLLDWLDGELDHVFTADEHTHPLVRRLATLQRLERWRKIGGTTHAGRISPTREDLDRFGFGEERPLRPHTNPQMQRLLVTSDKHLAVAPSTTHAQLGQPVAVLRWCFLSALPALFAPAAKACVVDRFVTREPAVTFRIPEEIAA